MEINEKTIEEWATKPENKERAKELGLRLIKFNKDARSLLAQPSLGDFEDKATKWAVDNQMKAKLLLMKLAKIFVA